MLETEDKKEEMDEKQGTMYEMNVKNIGKNVKVLLMDIFVCFLSALLVSSSLYYFSNYNRFAPGGVTGFASIIGSFLADGGLGDVTLNMSILMFAFNLPIFLLVAVFTSRKTGVMLIVYLVFQSALLMLF